jgi:hypothetical protein
MLKAADITQLGRYRYTDFNGDEPVTVVVINDDGALVACFPAEEGDDGAAVALGDLAGTFEGPLH